jgi:hypothetical protein
MTRAQPEQLRLHIAGQASRSAPGCPPRRSAARQLRASILNRRHHQRLNDKPNLLRIARGLNAYTGEPQIAEPGADEPVFGDGPSFRRVLVPIRVAADASQALAIAGQVCSSANGILQLLRVRIFDPPMRG